MQILSHRDRSDLRPDQYILISTTPIQGAPRGMSKELRAVVLDRDGRTCQVCGAVAGEIHDHDGRKVRLTIGHVIEVSQGGGDDLANLRAECSVCNEGLANVSLQRPAAIKLLTQIRRAPEKDQIEVLEWLRRKFP